MKELSLHILDIVQNSIDAGADTVYITVKEDLLTDKLTIYIEDNGCGMDKQIVEKVKDPFFTSRTTRKVGLGIPLFSAAAQRCGGDLKIESEPGKGTKLTACFIHSHIDRAPMGNLWDTLTSLIMCNGSVNFVYLHEFDRKTFSLDTREILKVLDGVPINSMEVINWIRDYLKEGINGLYGGVEK